ncbi:MAG: Wzz/FepE/Etk N-terminal domain-containing protein [Bacteroidota bacterium]
MSQSFENQNQLTEEVTLKELFFKLRSGIHYLLKKWKLILFVVLLGSGIAFLYALSQKIVYTATLTYAVEDDKASGGGLSGALGLASSLGLDLGGSASGAFGGMNLIELMRSRSLIEKTLLSEITVENKKMSLADYYITVHDLRKEWSKKPELSQMHFEISANRSAFTRTEDSVLGIIYSNINKNELNINQKDKKISIITIDEKSINELFAKFFCEALVREVSTFYIETRSKKAKMNVSILKLQSDSVRSELNSAIMGVAIANDNTYNLNPALNINRTPSSRRQVDIQANTAILTELVKNLELARVALRKETPLIQVIDAPIMPLPKEKLGKLKAIILGGFIGGFLIVFSLCINLFYKKIIE